MPEHCYLLITIILFFIDIYYFFKVNKIILSLYASSENKSTKEAIMITAIEIAKLVYVE